MRVEEVIGWQMRQRRDEAGMTQTQLGDSLGRLLGKPWSRQAVSHAEKGDRAFAAAELVALAIALRTTVTELLRPPVDETEVELADGSKLPRDVLFASLYPRPAHADRASMDAIQDQIGQLASGILRTGRDFDRLMQQVRLLDDMILGNLAAAGIDTVSRVDPHRQIKGYPPAIRGEWADPGRADRAGEEKP